MNKKLIFFIFVLVCSFHLRPGVFSGAVEGRDEAYVAPLSAKFPVLGRKIPFERRCAEHLCIAASIHGVLSGKRHSACRTKGAAAYNYCLGRFPTADSDKPAGGLYPFGYRIGDND